MLRYLTIVVFASLIVVAPLAGAAEKSDLPLLFEDDFEKGSDAWEPTDASAWKLNENDGGKAYGIIKRKSSYNPPHRSPHHISLIKDVEAGDFVLTLKIKSTLDTGGHRDACLFFNYQDPANFYYVHLGKKADPHSCQIMIVKDAPRKMITKKQTTGVPWDDDWHNVKVVRRVADGTIEIYFDDMDTPVMATIDKTFGTGRIGIGSFDDMDDFDDVKLYGKKASSQ